MPKKQIEDPAPFSQVLREARAAAGLTQSAAAAKIGVPTPTYLSWEQGARVPQWPAFRHAMASLEADPDAAAKKTIDEILIPAVSSWASQASRKQRVALLSWLNDHPPE